MESGLDSSSEVQTALQCLGPVSLGSPGAPGPLSPRQAELVLGQCSGEEVWPFRVAVVSLSVPAPIFKACGFRPLSVSGAGAARAAAGVVLSQGRDSASFQRTLRTLDLAL